MFDDPLGLSRSDPHPDRDRWQTIGKVGSVMPLVVHTWPEDGGDGRIISARKATAYERRAYEEGD